MKQNAEKPLPPATKLGELDSVTPMVDRFGRLEDEFSGLQLRLTSLLLLFLLLALLV